VLLWGILIVLISVVTTLAAFSRPATDIALFRALRWSPTLTRLEDVSELASVPALAGLSLLLLLGARCRAFVAVSASALLVGVGAGRVVSMLFPRDRPPGGPVAGSDSYPCLSVVVLTVLAVMVPVGLGILTGRRWPRVVGGAILCLLTLLVAVQQVAAGWCYPLDVLGGALIGGCAALTALALLDEPASGRFWVHRWCAASCPWRAVPVPVEEILELPAVPGVAGGGQRAVSRVHRLAIAWALGLVLALGVLSLSRGLPRSPESGVMGYGLDAPLHWGLLLLILAGVLLASRWHLAGTVLSGVAAALLGYAASVQYSPALAVAIAAVAFVPALLLWLEWHSRASLRAALGVAALTAVVLGGVVTAAADTHASYWGPTHPESATAPPDGDVIEWMWSGGVTATSAQVRARLAEPADAVRLVYAKGADVRRGAVRSEPVAPDDDHVVALTASGLEAASRYTYALEVDGDLVDERLGRLRTFPEGRSSFTFALSGDAYTGSNGQVYDAVRAQDPLFFLSMGDFYYGDVSQNDPARFQAQFDTSLTAPAQAALYASTSTAYVWGDHDFGGNDADSTSPSKPAAHTVYRQYVPHYPLAAGAQAPIYQAFTVGRVRFVMTDNRTARDPVGVEPRSALGGTQRRWLLAELAQAEEYAAIVWMNGDPWVDPADPGADTWAGFAAERRLIADAIAEAGVDNLLMVSADAHMLAFDDGTHTDYSRAKAGGFPLLQAAALDRRGSMKGGPYSGPVIPGGGQFATVRVEDRGDSVQMVLKGWDWRGTTVFTKVVSLPVAPGTP
jgi:phosphodiesterase/alkaline phosphatase D-like protein